MTMRTITKNLLGAAALAGAAMLASPASAEDCKPTELDLGGTKLEVGCKPLSIAFLSMGTNNQYLQSGITAAKDAAKEFGATIDVFDGGWTPATQFNQVQNILSSGKYNAILAEMADGRQACDILSKDAPKQGVLVAVANNPLCGKDIQEGEELWAPGTLTYVGGSQGREAYRDWMMWVAEQYPGPQKVAVITGPELISNTVNTDLAIKDVEAKYPDFKVVAYIRTDYSIPQANEKTLPVLQANPDLTLIISNYSDMTRGAVQAIKQAGREGTLKVVESGGSAWAFEAIRNGQVESTRTFTPYTEMYLGVKALADAWKGEPVGKYIALKSDLVTKDNVDQIKPEY
ncbi:MAG: sugar ABC transporter substrate-binding protein [Rhizobiaceae bacterium]